MKAALEGIRVLDLTRVLAGPWCAQNLADLGAEVIKVERPGAGDDTRGWGPPFLKDRDGHDTPDAAYYLAANRGKKSITIDISSAAGQEAIRALAKISDVVLENYKVGQLKKYGLDYDSLRQVNPALVYCSVTGFGQTGPWAHRPGYDFILQGMGGLMSITGEADDRPGGGPQKVGVAVVDLMTGMYSTQAVLAALFHRQRTGEGQYIDMALLDVQVAMLANMNTNYLVSGTPPRRWGNAHPNLVPYQTFKTADGWVIVAVGNDEQFRRYVESGGRPELATDPRFVRVQDRIRNRDALIPLLNDMMLTKPMTQWIDDLEAAGVPCGPINDIAQVFENPQVKARGLRVDIEREDAGPVKLVGSPMRFSETPVQYTLPPPRLGEHTTEVLRTLLGYSDAQIAALGNTA
ncbi:MAG TPA: CaiB/BaiF CoA-transferase family protein [Quisquiliibacterium sp.]|mgnify:CR=1 FL=1|nr:CaiB/BaiF CoA-transferase family protein [Quisquiliibacterium sp.]HQD82258.1 CaiB/BaiF CoA-transferase family protein [Quisquiliibacterium sp.]HQN12914.1 CaiB/BaiF CoA-transferase family protein [Quisquiliibacterium sp.]HQP66292.1 CaiB/BaiF CoA-transferase family protein [Quisquiliibacterium sp.]